jgi:hypothetical protein
VKLRLVFLLGDHHQGFVALWIAVLLATASPAGCIRG